MSGEQLDLKAVLEDAMVGIASRGQLLPPNGDYLPPRLWGALRRRLQSFYRASTGETDATLVLLPEGARIIGPCELDRETLQRAAEVAESLAVKGLSDGPEIARAIRALAGKAGEA